MNYSNAPRIIILGIDGLEYNLVKEWRLKNIMQKTYCKLDLSDYNVVVTPPIWGSMITGKIDEEVMGRWIKWAEVAGGNKNIKQKGWAKTGKILPSKLNFWLWNHIVDPLIGGDPFEKTANYVIEKKLPNIFQFFEKPWTNGLPSFGKNVSGPVQKKLTEQALRGEKTQYKKFIADEYKTDKQKLLTVLNKKEYDMIFWYTPILDNFGHMDMGKPVTLMMKHYLEINNLVDIVKNLCPESNIYIISDHGMEPFKMGWGMHSNHAFFSSNTGETIDKPFQLYDLVAKHKNN